MQFSNFLSSFKNSITLVHADPVVIKLKIIIPSFSTSFKISVLTNLKDSKSVQSINAPGVCLSKKSIESKFLMLSS